MPEDKADKRKDYLEERKLLIELEKSGAESFDKTITTLSAGSLGLSITFIHNIAPEPDIETIWMLVIAWSGFGLALFLTLLSFLASQSAMRKQRELLDQDYQGNSHHKSRTSWIAKVTNILNWSSIVFFMIGVIFLAWFAVNNLPH